MEPAARAERFPRREAQRQVIIRYQQRTLADDFPNLTLVQLKEQYKLACKAGDKFDTEHMKAVDEVDATFEEVGQLDEDLAAIELIKIDAFVRYQERITILEEQVGQNDGGYVAGAERPVRPIHDSYIGKIKPMKFDGRFSQWPQWRAMYDSLIHNKEFTTTEKFHFLADALKGGKEEHLIRGWSIIGENYEEFYNALVQKFERPYRITMAHLTELHQVPKPEYETYDGLQAMIEGTNRCLRQLRVAGSPVEHWDHLMVYHLVSRMPVETLTAWEHEADLQDMPTKERVIEFLERRARGMVHMGSIESGAQTIEQKITGAKLKIKPIEMVTSNPTNATVQIKSELKCFKCGGAHPLYRCNELLKRSLPERMKLVRSLKLCFNCLRPGHEAGTNKCNFGPCRLCKKTVYHNTTLCPESKRAVVNVVIGAEAKEADPRTSRTPSNFQ